MTDLKELYVAVVVLASLNYVIMRVEKSTDCSTLISYLTVNVTYYLISMTLLEQSCFNVLSIC